MESKMQDVIEGGIETCKEMKERIGYLEKRNDEYFSALEAIKAIHWGNDGDCGALAIIDKVL